MANGSRSTRGDTWEKRGKGRWTHPEHRQFLDGLKQHGRDWKLIADLVPTRTIVQIRTHAQKYFLKIEKGQCFPEEPYESDDSHTDSGYPYSDPGSPSHASPDSAVAERRSSPSPVGSPVSRPSATPKPARPVRRSSSSIALKRTAAAAGAGSRPATRRAPPSTRSREANAKRRKMMSEQQELPDLGAAAAGRSSSDATAASAAAVVVGRSTRSSRQGQGPQQTIKLKQKQKPDGGTDGAGAANAKERHLPFPGTCPSSSALLPGSIPAGRAAPPPLTAATLGKFDSSGLAAPADDDDSDSLAPEVVGFLHGPDVGAGGPGPYEEEKGAVGGRAGAGAGGDVCTTAVNLDQDARPSDSWSTSSFSGYTSSSGSAASANDLDLDLGGDLGAVAADFLEDPHLLYNLFGAYPEPTVGANSAVEGMVGPDDSADKGMALPGAGAVPGVANSVVVSAGLTGGGVVACNDHDHHDLMMVDSCCSQGQVQGLGTGLGPGPGGGRGFGGRNGSGKEGEDEGEEEKPTIINSPLSGVAVSASASVSGVLTAGALGGGGRCPEGPSVGAAVAAVAELPMAVPVPNPAPMMVPAVAAGEGQMMASPIPFTPLPASAGGEGPEGGAGKLEGEDGSSSCSTTVPPDADVERVLLGMGGVEGCCPGPEGGLKEEEAFSFDPTYSDDLYRFFLPEGDAGDL